MIPLRWFTPLSFGVGVALCVMLAAAWSPAQVSKHVSLVTTSEPIPGNELTVTALLTSSAGIERVVIVYRPFGESEYRRAEMDVRGIQATVTLPGSIIQPPSLEYYIVVAFADGSLESYPLSESADPYRTPPQRTVQLLVQPRASRTGILFLSPDTDEPIPPEDLVVSFSLLRVSRTVDRRATRVQLDGVDVTPVVVMSGDIGVFSPENSRLSVTPGRHEVSVALFDSGGAPLGNASCTFTIAGPQLAGSMESQIKYFGAISLESRHEDVADEGTWYHRGNLSLRAQYDDWRMTTNMFLTSDESPNLQPQDRFYIAAESPWVKLGYGDYSPSFPDLILSGKRVRGVHAALHLGFFGLAVSSGQTTRGIEGALLKAIPDSQLVTEQTADPGAAYAPMAPGLWGKYSFGTFARNLFIIRPSFGTGETWQFGLTYMKSKDDMGSITYGIRPQEDLVIGTDFVVRLDERRIELSGQAAFSMYNTDYSGGNITDERIVERWPNSEGTRNTVRWLRNILSPYITVNENLRPLSLARPSTAVGEAAVELRYFQQDLKFTYLYRGSDYTSFGQAFLRTDVQGYNVNDRFRLLENALSFTLGYERLHDNTSKTKAATTYFTTFTMAVTYAPREGFPPITVGYNRFSNDNGLDAGSRDSLSAIDDVTNRLFLQTSYDFELGLPQTASFSLSTSHRSDATVRALEVSNTTVGLSLATRYGSNLTTSVDLALNYNRLPVSGSAGQFRDLDYRSLGFQARYEVVKDLLTTQGSVSPTFGDFRRTVVNLDMELLVGSATHVTAEYGLLANQGDPNENFLSLRCRYDI